jgi:adenylosuccinate synthase
MPSTAIIGLQFGDEGKGKIVDYLAEDHDYVVRFQGGPNAGHTIVIGDNEYILHNYPGGAFRNKRCLIGTGCQVNPGTLCKEIASLRENGFNVDLGIDYRAHVIMPYHITFDGLEERARGSGKIGTTKRGIGPSYSDRKSRHGIRIGDLERIIGKERDRAIDLLAQRYAEKERIIGLYKGERLKPFDEVVSELEREAAMLANYVCDVSYEVDRALREGASVLFEGAQGTFLDNDFGTYPYVTSSNTISGAIPVGVGISPQVLEGLNVIGIAKLYTTRVGEGPFPSEILDERLQNRIREKGNEYGATTRRPRRVGYLDLALLNEACRLNGVSNLILTKTDVFSGEPVFRIAIGYYTRDDGKSVYNVRPRWDRNIVDVSYIRFEGFSLPQGLNCKEDIPCELKNILDYVSSKLDVPIYAITNGPERGQFIRL